MKSQSSYGIYGFRFTEPEQLPLLNLFAAGHAAETSTAYHWSGLERTDGPLLLFQYTTAGTGIFELNGHSYRVGPGRAFMAEIPGNHRYYYPGGPEAWEFYFVLFRPQPMLPLWESVKERLGVTPALDPSGLPVRRLRDITLEAQAGRITDPYIASSLLYQFLMELGRLAASGPRQRENWPAAIRSAAAYMDTHYASMLGQEQLAETVGLSKYHFLRTFSKYAGVTPNDYLNRVRIEHAVELLRTTNDGIEAIAGRVGYSTGSYFIKVFRKLTGQTPGEFRSGNGSLQYNRLFFN